MDNAIALPQTLLFCSVFTLVHELQGNPLFKDCQRALFLHLAREAALWTVLSQRKIQSKAAPLTPVQPEWTVQYLVYSILGFLPRGQWKFPATGTVWKLLPRGQLQVSLKRKLYIMRRPINFTTRNAYSYASTPVTIIPTLTWCPQCEA